MLLLGVGGLSMGYSVGLKSPETSAYIWGIGRELWLISAAGRGAAIKWLGMV